MRCPSATSLALWFPSCLTANTKWPLIFWFFSPSVQAINQEIKSLKNSFDHTDEGDLKYYSYLGTWFIKHNDGQIKLQQQKTIDNCLSLLGMDPTSENVKQHDTPAESSKVLHANESGLDQKQN